MRIQTLILCLLFCVASVFAKDVITKTDGSKIDAKVEEITETVIKYRRASNPTGPVYIIQISSVATVVYENGDVDTFKEEFTYPTVQHTDTFGSSDDELMKIAEVEDNTLINRFSSKNVSDAQLLQLVNPSDKLSSKASTYRKIGWIGAGVLAAGGIIFGSVVYSWGQPTGAVLLAGSAGLVAGTIWYLGFNMKANSLMKQAKQLYIAKIVDCEVFQFEDYSLTAGINIMGNRMVNSHSLGISLGLNF